MVSQPKYTQAISQQPAISRINTVMEQELATLADPNKPWGQGEVCNSLAADAPGADHLAPLTMQERTRRYLEQGENLLYCTSPQSLVSWYFYAHASDSGQTPKSFHLWTCLSMLAALCQDKFFYQKFRGVHTVPNLYVILVGPSGLGKDTAIGVGLDYIRPYRDLTRTFAGRLTHASFTDFLCKPRGALSVNVRRSGMAGEDLDSNFPHSDSAVAWVVTPELAQSISAGTKAAELIKLMTSVYTATSREFEEYTRQWGYHLAVSPCVNWLAGTTQEWLLKSIGQADIKGGFASRVVWVIEDYMLDKLCGHPVYPGNFEEVKKYIEWRLFQIAMDPGGEIKLSIAARVELDTWFETWRASAILEGSEGDKNLLPLFVRGHDLAVKLSMLLRIAAMGAEEGYDVKNPNRLQIQQPEVYTACRWVEQLLLIHYPKLIRSANMSPEDGNAQQVFIQILDGMSKHGQLPVRKTELRQMAFRRGIKAKMIYDVESLLYQCQAIIIERNIAGDEYFRWVGKLEDWV